MKNKKQITKYLTILVLILGVSFVIKSQNDTKDSPPKLSFDIAKYTALIERGEGEGGFYRNRDDQKTFEEGYKAAKDEDKTILKQNLNFVYITKDGTLEEILKWTRSKDYATAVFTWENDTWISWPDNNTICEEASCEQPIKVGNPLIKACEAVIIASWGGGMDGFNMRGTQTAPPVECGPRELKPGEWKLLGSSQGDLKAYLQTEHTIYVIMDEDDQDNKKAKDQYLKLDEDNIDENTYNLAWVRFDGVENKIAEAPISVEIKEGLEGFNMKVGDEIYSLDTPMFGKDAEVKEEIKSDNKEDPGNQKIVEEVEEEEVEDEEDELKKAKDRIEKLQEELKEKIAKRKTEEKLSCEEKSIDGQNYNWCPPTQCALYIFGEFKNKVTNLEKAAKFSASEAISNETGITFSLAGTDHNCYETWDYIWKKTYGDLTFQGSTTSQQIEQAITTLTSYVEAYIQQDENYTYLLNLP